MDWARQVVDAKWVKLIDAAWQEREGVRFGEKIGQRARQEALKETLDFMEYACNLNIEIGRNPDVQSSGGDI